MTEILLVYFAIAAVVAFIRFGMALRLYGFEFLEWGDVRRAVLCGLTWPAAFFFWREKL